MNWTDSTEVDPIFHSQASGRRGNYVLGKVSSGFCVTMFFKFRSGNAFIGNGATMDEAKAVAERFDKSDEELKP